MHERFDLVLLFMPGVLSHHGSSEELHRHVHNPHFEMMSMSRT